MADSVISMEVLGQLIGSDVAIGWYEALNDAAQAYNINTTQRIAAWLGQLMQESAKFQLLEESLNYSSSALLRVFPTHFTPAEADYYAHKPQDIANRAYGNRMGNGNEASGDGWRYRGRGLIQLTGKDNYITVSQALNYDFINDPNALLEPDWAALSAAWFWNSRRCNALADKEDYTAVTRAINGGINGLDMRLAYTQQAVSVLTSNA